MWCEEAARACRRPAQTGVARCLSALSAPAPAWCRRALGGRRTGDPCLCWAGRYAAGAAAAAGGDGDTSDIIPDIAILDDMPMDFNNINDFLQAVDTKPPIFGLNPPPL